MYDEKRWLAALFCACVCMWPADNAHAAKKPNVLFVAVDDMRDWVNCLGGYAGTVHTPNIDRLAARGVLFTNAHCPSPKCAPSRAAIMTGMRPSSTGLYDNGHWWLPNLPNVKTIPMHFRNHGYHVSGAGKIFHHTAGNHPPNQWDEFQPIRFRIDPWFRGDKLNYPWSRVAPFPDGFPFSNVTGLGHENDWGALPIDDREYDDHASVDFAISKLGKRHETPFFVACGLFRPHLPWYVPQSFFDLYDLDQVVLPMVRSDDLRDVPDAGRRFAKAKRADFDSIVGAGKWKHGVRAYLASISYADAQLGRLLDALDASPYRDSTIVVFWSDHGWHLGEKGHWHKTTLWEEATRVPLIVAASGYRPGVCKRPVSLLDIYPTLVELSGLTPIEAHDGVSLTPLLVDPTAQWDHPAVTEYKRGNAAVRSEHFRYIRYHDGSEELYDHRSDPSEWTNLADRREHQDVKKRLGKWITQDWADSKPTKKAFQFDPDAFRWTNIKSGATFDGK